jgi:hypothetical protein
MAKQVQSKRKFEQSNAEINEALKYALHRMNLTGSIVPGDETIIQIKVPINIWSWGETVDIRVRQSGEVEITSTCSNSIQIVDWGKNKQNIETISTCMDEYFRGYRSFK